MPHPSARSSRRVAGVVALALSAVRCASPTAVHETGALLADPDFRTDRASYTLTAGASGYEGRIDVTYTNHTGDTVYFVNCRGGTGVELQQRVANEWRTVWSPVLLACLSPAIVVAPNAAWQTVVSIYGGYPGTNTAPQFSTTDLAGTYRLVWTEALSSYQTSLPFGEALPMERRVSNTFTLQVAPR